jgi:hypothetical protein
VSKSNILKIIVRRSLIRLYDVLSIILFSAATSVFIDGLTSTDNLSVERRICIILCSLFLLISGWYTYSLFDKVNSCLSVRKMDAAAIKHIVESGKSSIFIMHFALAWIFLIAAGIIFLLISSGLV